jgi:nickel-dependent lactate racemase
MHKIAWKIAPREYPGVPNIKTAVKEALKKPFGTALSELVKPGDKVAIAVDDLTRPTPQSELLPIVVDELVTLGIKEKDITVIIGLGAHRRMSPAEIDARFGPVAKRVGAIVNHDTDDCVAIGKTSTGGEIAVNRLFWQSDAKIAVGCILPHIYAGWSGGAKMIQPGISSVKTTTHVHRIANLHLYDILGNTENLVRTEMEQIAAVAGLKFIVNVVLNDKNEVISVVAGDTVLAHRAGVKEAEKVYGWNGLKPVDVAIAYAPGVATDLWQSAKSLTVGAMAIKQGGTVILVAACPEGIAPGHPIIKSLGTTSFDEALHRVDNGLLDDTVGALVYMTVAKCREKGRIILVSSGISKEDATCLGLESAADVDEAMRMALGHTNAEAEVGIIECAGELSISIKEEL